MRCAVYDPGSGVILRTVTCPAQHMAAQARTGEAVVEVEVGSEVSDATHRIEDGAPVPL